MTAVARVIAVLVIVLFIMPYIYIYSDSFRRFKITHLYGGTVDYGIIYKFLKVPFKDSALSTCTPSDVILMHSEPRPSVGCRNQSHPEGISFMCIKPEPVTCDQSLPGARETFFRNIAQTTAKCHNRWDVGNILLDGVWRTCMSQPYALKKNACLVYSFGINHEWSFDDTISKVYRCEVHAFDPSMDTADHKRDDRITFHNLGVKGHGTVFKDSNQYKWKMLSINDIIQLLGHHNRTIDILKMDIEYAEWDAFEDLLQTDRLKNVKQLVTEFHVWTDHAFAYVRFNRIITALANAGFEKWLINNKTFSYMDVILPDTKQITSYHFQADVSYINTKFL